MQMVESVEITTLVHGGSGLGHGEDGKAVFVAGAIPGDHVRCRTVQEKKRYRKADLVELLTSSPQRIVPACSHFGDCGGCDWQMLSYSDQCDWKQRLFEQSCAHQLGEEVIERMVALRVADEPFGYRSRVQMKCHAAHGAFALGFYRRGTHYVVQVDHCPILAPSLNALLGPLRQLFAGSDYADQVPQIDLATGDDRAVRLVIHYRGDVTDRFCGWLGRRVSGLKAAVLVQSGRKQQLRCVQGGELLTIQVDDPPLALHYGPGGFAQINLAQNRELVRRVLDWAAVTEQEKVLDLYCGMGNFSLPLARRAARVIGVEDYAPSIAQARDNARQAGLTAEFHVQPAADFLAGWREPLDLVVLDPPRTGAWEAVGPLLEALPQRIVYVSCDQQTLLRDLKPLLGRAYQLERIGAVDLFPQTHHTEAVALLRRRSVV
ncbi:MAG: methyltransferase domain-containing protein [Desulfuromonadaceae bacterium]|nr:methyltransferase domain-containing protein [Desulfuromonadaceae bacterium]